MVQALAVGFVMQEAMLEASLGRVAAPLYVPVQPVALGSVIQAFIGVSSLLAELTRAGRLVEAV